MANATAFKYVLPGNVECNSFCEMNAKFIDTFYTAWHQGGLFYVPPVSTLKHLEPITGLAGEPAPNADPLAFGRMRDAQKGELDEHLILRYFHKLFGERCEKSFVFHNLKITETKVNLLKRVIQYELQLCADRQAALLAKVADIFPPRKGTRKITDLEIDFIVVDYDCDLITVGEVKGRSSAKSASATRLKSAREQLSRDAKFLKLLLEIFGSAEDICSFNLSPILVNDIADESYTEALSKHPLNDEYPLAISKESPGDVLSFDHFKVWWLELGAKRTLLKQSSAVYRSLVPVLVALSVSLGSEYSNFAISEAHESLHSATLMDVMDEQIRSERFVLTSPDGRRSNVLSNVTPVSRDLSFAWAKTLRLFYLTPDQQEIYFDKTSDDRVRIIRGPAGVGKTVLLMFKMAEVAEKSLVTTPILILCNGIFVHRYVEFLRANNLNPTLLREATSANALQGVESAGSYMHELSTVAELALPKIVQLRLSPGRTFVAELREFANAIMKCSSTVRIKYYKCSKLRLKGPDIQFTFGLCHLFIDDADLNILEDLFNSYKASDATTQQTEEYCWIAFDHAQTVTREIEEGETTFSLNEKLESFVTSRGGYAVATNEVLRNSSEIISINGAIAKHINTLHYLTDSTMIPICPHNFRTGLVEIFDLYDESSLPNCLERIEIYEDVFARFTSFVAGLIKLRIAGESQLTNDALSSQHRFAILFVDGSDRFYRNAVNILCGSKIADSVLDVAIADDLAVTAQQACVIQQAAKTKSFEWECVLLVVPFRYIYFPGSQRVVLPTDDGKRAITSEFWKNLYQASTRPRTKLFVVGPTFYESYLQPIGVPIDAVIIRKFVVADTEFKEDPNVTYSTEATEWIRCIQPELFGAGYVLI